MRCQSCGQSLHEIKGWIRPDLEEFQELNAKCFEASDGVLDVKSRKIIEAVTTEVQILDWRDDGSGIVCALGFATADIDLLNFQYEFGDARFDVRFYSGESVDLLISLLAQARTAMLAQASRPVPKLHKYEGGES